MNFYMLASALAVKVEYLVSNNCFTELILACKGRILGFQQLLY